MPNEVMHCWPTHWLEAAKLAGFAERDGDAWFFRDDKTRDMLAEFGAALVAAARAQALEDAARLIDETWHRTPAEYAAAIRALKEKT